MNSLRCEAPSENISDLATAHTSCANAKLYNQKNHPPTKKKKKTQNIYFDKAIEFKTTRSFFKIIINCRRLEWPWSHDKAQNIFCSVFNQIVAVYCARRARVRLHIFSDQYLNQILYLIMFWIIHSFRGNVSCRCC